MTNHFPIRDSVGFRIRDRHLRQSSNDFLTPFSSKYGLAKGS
jgi:hypothetical protein